MSVVIAIKDKKTKSIYVGCDCQVSCSNLKSNLKGESQKIWEIPINNNNLICGGVGSLRAVQLIQVYPDIFETDNIYVHGLNLKYVITDLYDNLYNVLVDHRAITLDTQGKPLQTILSSFMFAYRDKCFKIDHEGAAEEIDDYLVMGSGDEIAIGVLEANKDKRPEERIKEAIKACSDKTLFVNNNIKILNTNKVGK